MPAPPAGSRSASATAEPWLDADAVDPSWRPPSPAQAPEPERRTIPTVVIVGLVVVVLVLAGAGLWAAGGFEKRDDLRIPTPPGTLISTGPYELTFTSATATQKKDGDKLEWKVTAIGSGRTTASTSMAPNYSDNGMFVSRDPKTKQVQVADGRQFGSATNSRSRGDTFTPGLAPIAYEVTFTYDGAFVPGDTIELAVFTLHYVDNSLLKDGSKNWRNNQKFYSLMLPLKVVAEDS